MPTLPRYGSTLWAKSANRRASIRLYRGELRGLQLRALLHFLALSPKGDKARKLEGRTFEVTLKPQSQIRVKPEIVHADNLVVPENRKNLAASEPQKILFDFWPPALRG